MLKSSKFNSRFKENFTLPTASKRNLIYYKVFVKGKLQISIIWLKLLKIDTAMS
jgi:hypothetical protein